MRSLTKIFLFGLAIGVVLGLCMWPIAQHFLVERFLSENIGIYGTVEYSPTPDPTASAMPPEGYFISFQTRFYLDHIDSRFHNKSVFVTGCPLSIKCGPDGGAQFPQLKVRDIQEINR